MKKILTIMTISIIVLVGCDTSENITTKKEKIKTSTDYYKDEIKKMTDKDIYKMSKKELTILRRQKIGIIYQFYNLIPTLNVEENITLPIELDRKKIDTKKLDEIIKFLGLEKRKKHLPNELSGGQQQKVAIGRALMINPTIILADEPTGNLDSKSSEEIMKVLKKANKDDKQTIIMITHNLEIAKLADRIIKIEDGRII